jgi:hypothetical protein
MNSRVSQRTLALFKHSWFFSFIIIYCFVLIIFKALEVDHNNLTAVPPSLGKCTKLASLSLHDNNLRTLPKELGSLRCKITLDGNPLEDPLMGMYLIYPPYHTPLNSKDTTLGQGHYLTTWVNPSLMPPPSLLPYQHYTILKYH